MFHRVKSEDQSEAIDTQKQAPAKSSAQSVTKKSAAEKTVSNETIQQAPATQPVAQSAQTPTQTTQTPKKETQTMSQATDTKQDTQTTPANEASAEAYQRAPAQTAGYPGGYPGYSATSGQEDANEGDRRLTIGRGITMSGEIESCDYLLVEGTVEAALKGASVLDIAESGVFYGTVEIADATIAGRFEGDITAHGRLTLREGASVTGTISYKELEIEAGAVIDGKLTPLGVAPAAAAPKPAAAAKPAAKAKVQPAAAEVKTEAANNDGGLFTKAAASAE